MLPPEDVQGIKAPVRGGGVCIYCGSDGGSDGLRDEHIIPFALGGKAVLQEASCSSCERVTSYLDGYLANQTYRFMRVHSNVQSRSGHPDVLPAHVNTADGPRVLDLAPKDHPYFLHMPLWNRPGIIRGNLPSSDFGHAKAHVYWYIPPSMRDTLGLRHGEIAEVRDTTPMPNIQTFARAIAKIGYCQAILRYGLDGFRPFATADIILGKYPNVPYFVGVHHADPPPPDKNGVLHAIHFTNVTCGRMKYFTAFVRLFAHSGTAGCGMPLYEVVIGCEADRRVVKKWPTRLPKTILL